MIAKKKKEAEKIVEITLSSSSSSSSSCMSIPKRKNWRQPLQKKEKSGTGKPLSLIRKSYPQEEKKPVRQKSPESLPSTRFERRFPCGIGDCKWVFTRKDHVPRHQKRCHSDVILEEAGKGSSIFEGKKK